MTTTSKFSKSATLAIVSALAGSCSVREVTEDPTCCSIPGNGAAGQPPVAGSSAQPANPSAGAFALAPSAVAGAANSSGGALMIAAGTSSVSTDATGGILSASGASSALNLAGATSPSSRGGGSALSEGGAAINAGAGSSLAGALSRGDNPIAGARAAGGARAAAGGATFALGGASITLGGAVSRSSGGTTAAAGAPAVTDAEIIRWASAQCTKLASCYPAYLTWMYASQANCLARVAAGLRWNASLPGSGTTDASIEACAKAVEAQTCSRFFSAGATVAECQFFGQRSLYEPCEAGSQCASGQCSSSDYSCGVCIPAPRTGSYCTDHSDCNTLGGEYCASDGQCAAIPQQGDPCDDSTCDRGLTCFNGICAVPRSDGESCDTDGITAPACDYDQGYFCSSSNTCAPLKWSSTGQGCGMVSGVLTLCQGLGTCTGITSGSTIGICAAGPSTGQACDNIDGPSCTYPDVCTGGYCKAPPNSYTCG